MFEYMDRFVGYAMHDDLMMRTKTDVQVAEAARVLKRQAMPRRSYRASVARALVALATRIAPTVAAPNPSTPALVQ